MSSEGILIQDMVIAKACSGIIMRSEQQPEVGVLERTFVDMGILPQAMTPNGQILYGRKGTGKSHLLRVLGATIGRETSGLAIYVDLRTLGSADLITDQSRPLSVRCISLYRDLLSAVQYQLLDVATEPARSTSGAGFEEISRLADVLRRFAGTVTEREITSELQSYESQEGRAGLSLAPHAIGVNLGSTDKNAASAKVSNRYTETVEDILVFAEVAEALRRAISAMEIQRLWILLDEWTAIPPDAQPYIADFIKRSLLPVPQLTVKIAAVQNRSQFSFVTPQSQRIGFELGSDIQASLDLDDYYVYDRAPSRVVTYFSELLYRHLCAESPTDYLHNHHGITNYEDLVAYLFSGPTAFRELVRAGEGIVRDFLGIFTACFFHALRRGANAIDPTAVRDSARTWFETDKAPNLDQAQARVLRNIIVQVVGQKRGRYFLLEQQVSSDEKIQSLYELRVLHLIRRGISNRANPGIRYDMFTLDYGTYADLLGQNESGLEIESAQGDSTYQLMASSDSALVCVTLDSAVLSTGSEHG
jgi:hypothetical protein